MDVTYVRALYDFNTTDPGEIAFRSGEVILSLYSVDDNWTCGKLRGQTGIFPTAFIEPVTLPPVQADQKLFAVTEDFPSTLSGDLELNKGDVVIGLKSIDKSWWHGSNGDKYGMFPATHVRQLDTAPGCENTGYKQSNLVSASGATTSESVLNKPIQPAKSGEQENVFIAKAVATMPLTAQLSDEIGFENGDVVNIIRKIDSDFALGECNGKTGNFPLSFVELIEGSLGSSTNTEKKKSKFRWWEEESNNGEINQSSSTNYNDNSYNLGEYASQSLQSEPATQETPNCVITDHSVMTSTVAYTNHLEPAEVKTHKRTGSYTQENTRSYDTSITPYGKTVFPFVAENLNELTFFDNEIVTLIQHVNDQWMEGEIDGKRGIFPTSYVNIIVDCPWCEDYQPVCNDNDLQQNDIQFNEREVTDNQSNQQSQSDLNTTLENNEADQIQINEPYDRQNTQNEFESEPQYGRVLYDFKPDNPEDLCVSEGDTVTILKKADEHWFEVTHDDGRHGFCPINYVEVITSEPSVTVNEEQVTCTQKVEDDKTKIGENHRFSDISSVGSNHEITSKCENITDTETKPVIIVKPKPLIKPKPALKPKPGLVKSTSGENVPIDMTSPTSKSPVDNITSQSSSADELTHVTDTVLQQQQIKTESEQATHNTNNVITQPKRPPIPATKRIANSSKKTPPTGPVFARTNSFTMDSSLDDIIKDQMKVATEEAESRSRSSSVRSDTSDTSTTASQPAAVTPKCGAPPKNYEPLKELQNTNNNRHKMPMHSNQEEKRIAFSTFYTTQTSVEGSTPTSMRGTPGNRNINYRPRPVPNRPALPPPVTSQTQDRGKYRSVRPTPARPTNQRPNIMPSIAGKTTNLMPQRPAPPRPTAARVTANDLMAFSPDRENQPQIDEEVTAEEAENVQVVADLNQRICEIEDDIQAYTKNKQELERFVNKHKDGTSPEETQKVKENLDFTVANITGLTEELTQLRENLYEFRPERRAIDEELQKQAEHQRYLVEEQKRREQEEKKHKLEAVNKRRETRVHVIQELIQTEKDYLHSISVCYDTFNNETAVKHPQVDVAALFGNMEEVIELSQRLLVSLEEATQGKEFEQQKIGECFVSLKKDMIKVFAPYCRNHDDIITLLENYEKNPEIQEYFIQRVEKMKDQITVFDVGSILIKPVQRVLKYPLLLNELIKNTEEDHPDKFHLLGAITCMTQVAANINEFKRRKDLVKKYKVEKKEDFGDKLARLNVHSTKKKLSRISAKLVGVQEIDEHFNREEKKFKNLESTVRTLVRNMSQYIEQVQLSVFNLETLANDVSDYYGDRRVQPEVQQYGQVANHIATKHFHKFKKCVEVPVLHPLNRLLILYQAPNKVIKKRHDKLIDYDSFEVKGVHDSQLAKNVQMVKKNYEALNAQLLDELPQLYELSMEVIHDCLRRFVNAQKQFYGSCLDEMYTLLGLQLVLDTSEQAIIDLFNAGHFQVVEKLSDLSFVTKAFNPRLEEKKVPVKGRRSSELRSSSVSQDVPSSTSQTMEQRKQLQQQFGTGDRLFVVTQNHLATQIMDIAVNVGWLVGVIKEGDPMGNKERWYVDDGKKKGFVSKRYLSPYTYKQTPTPSISSEMDLLGDIMDVQPVSPGYLSAGHPDPFDTTTSVFDQPLQPQISSNGNTSYFYRTASVPSPVLQPQPVGRSGHSPVTKHLSESGTMEPVINMDSGISMSQFSQGVGTKPPPISRGDTFEQLEEAQYYQAIYPFESRGEMEISLKEGQYVKVIEKHDLEGNDEWWLVESQGGRGYAPANYIEEVK